MALTTQLKFLANRLLKPVNLKIDSLTIERAEMARLDKLKQLGQFRDQVLPIPKPIAEWDSRPAFAALTRYQDRFAALADPETNDVGYSYRNDFFSSPDAEVLYTFVREYKPGVIVEVGCGNSTRVIRQAIIDNGGGTTLIAIDPQPRIEVVTFVDHHYRQRVEEFPPTKLAGLLHPGDFLFIDSSHEIKPGNDVVYLLLQLVPLLAPGVVIHIHDIFLPYEYPCHWIMEQRHPWTEQYLVQAMLAYSDSFAVLWPGQYAQRTSPEFTRSFPHTDRHCAHSLWLRKQR